jgi:exosortase/archaeosortase family protein
MMKFSSILRFGLIPVVLVIMACWIWARDLSWTDSPADTLPVLAGLALLCWLGSPWRKREPTGPVVRWRMLSGALLLIAGVASNLIILMALGWAFCLLEWIRSSFLQGSVNPTRLALLGFLSFPWLVTDFAAVGWWFRLSGTWATEQVFTLLGFNADAYGTSIVIEGFPVDIVESCSGINILQSILLAGTMAALIFFRRERGFWLAFSALPLLAWLSNTFRIIVVTAAGLTSGVEFASGWFHTWGGLFSVAIMFFTSLVLFSRLGEPRHAVSRTHAR